MVMGAGVVYTILLYIGKLSDGSYVALQIATVGAYIAANTYQKVQEVKAASDGQASE